jgi:hypothetical protein
MATQEAIDQAKSRFGESAVYQAIELVALADPDSAYTMCEDTGQFDIAEAIEFLYFDGAAED